MNVEHTRLWTDRFYDAINPETLCVGFHKADPGWVSPPKQGVLTDFDLWYIAAGDGGALLDGQWHNFRAGDLLTLKPGCAYQRERTSREAPFQIYFSHVLPFGRQKQALDEALARAWPLKISLLHRPEFLGIFNRLFEAYATRPQRRPSLAVKGLMLQLLHVVFEELQRRPAALPPRACRSLLRAKEMIEARYAGDVRLKEIAAHCDLSPSHLSALFARHMGFPPIEYLLRIRLREAKLLLAKGARVKEVAQTVGFHSQHYFSRLFRKKTGLSPTEFGLQHAGK